MELVRPAHEHLESYRRALERGWSPDSLRPQAATEELEEIGLDGDARVPRGDTPRDERSREEPAPARAQRACGARRVIHPVLWGGREVRVARIRY